MKRAVLMSLLLHSSFLVKPSNAQNNKIIQLHQPEYNKSETPETLTEPQPSSNVQKIKKSGGEFREFSVPDFSNDQLNEAFQTFGKRLKGNLINTSLNLISDENKTEKERPHGLEESNDVQSKENTSMSPVKDDKVENVIRFHDVDDKNVLMNASVVEDSSRFKQLNLSEVNPKVNMTGLENITIVLQEPNNDTFDQGYFEVIVPRSVVRNDTEMRSILESVRDSVNEATNLGKENIVRSDTVELFTPSSIDRADKILVNKSPTYKRKSGRKINYGKRYPYNSFGRTKKKSRKRSKNKKPIDNRQIHEELKCDNRSAGNTPPHFKQDRRMVNEDYFHQFGLRVPEDTKPAPDFPYKFEPIDRQYAEGFPHTNYSHQGVTKALFQPHQDQVSRSFSYHESQGFNGDAFFNNYRPLGHQSTSSQFFQRKNEYGPVTFGIDHSPQAAHDEHKTITLTKEIPVPYTVKIEKPVPYPVYVKVPYDKPYPVIVPKPYKVVHEVLQPYHIQIKVPKPYQVIKHVPTPVKVPVERPYPVPVPKPYQVTVEKKVPVVVEKRVPYPVHVPVDRPYPVHIPIPKHVPYTVEKKYPVEVKVPVDKPYPVYIPKPYAVHVEKPVPHTVEKHVPYPVKVPVRYPVRVPVPYQVVRHVPVYEHGPDDSHSEFY